MLHLCCVMNAIAVILEVSNGVSIAVMFVNALVIVSGIILCSTKSLFCAQRVMPRAHVTDEGPAVESFLELELAQHVYNNENVIDLLSPRSSLPTARPIPIAIPKMSTSTSKSFCLLTPTSTSPFTPRFIPPPPKDPPPPITKRQKNGNETYRKYQPQLTNRSQESTELVTARALFDIPTASPLEDLTPTEPKKFSRHQWYEPTVQELQRFQTVDIEMNWTTFRILRDLSIVLAFAAAVGFGVYISGMYFSHDPSRAITTPLQVSNSTLIDKHFLGFGNWTSFSSNCCCRDLDGDGHTEVWTCDAGVGWEHSRQRRRIWNRDGTEQSGLPLREFCGQKFNYVVKWVTSEDNGLVLGVDLGNQPNNLTKIAKEYLW
eukprot:c4458_g1_i2.p1 GENE.c4458_g1_i2~~c4458_g1_i2.p1  ORF type:complete len:375 (-),score=95.95 c4458_g1_i2:18-1142(-)